MDSLKKLITCGYCKSFFKSPVLLKCCSEKVCKQHILDFKINNTKMMKCAFCGKEKHHDENYFTIDKSLSEFIGLDSIKSLIENYKKASEKFEKLNTNLKAYNNLKENPEQFVENYFNQIIDKVEQAKKHLINKVEKMAKNMITEIGNHQKGYYKYVVSLGHTSQDDNDLNKEILIQNWNSLDSNEYETKAQEFENMNNMILNKIEKLQKVYLLDKSFNFVENFNIDENFLGKYTIDEFNLASVYPNKMDNVNEANKRKKDKDVCFDSIQFNF